MKPIARITAIAAVLALLLSPISADAMTTFNGGPLTNLDPTTATVHIALSNFSTKGGLYIQECVAGVDGARPSMCNKAAELWISNDSHASFAPTADIIFKPQAMFTSGTTAVDCRVSMCGAFLRFDHTVQGDTSEDQFIALTFTAGGVVVPTLPTDEITATLGGATLSTRTPVEFAYRSPALIIATSKAGAPLTYASLAPECALDGTRVTALKGSGYCDIALTSAGTSSAAGVTAHFPLKLIPGNQTIIAKAMPTTLKAKRSAVLSKKTTFGASIKYSASGACVVKGNTLRGVRVGTCTLKASAPAKAGMWNSIENTYRISIK